MTETPLTSKVNGVSVISTMNCRHIHYRAHGLDTRYANADPAGTTYLRTSIRAVGGAACYDTVWLLRSPHATSTATPQWQPGGSDPERTQTILPGKDVRCRARLVRGRGGCGTR